MKLKDVLKNEIGLITDIPETHVMKDKKITIHPLTVRQVGQINPYLLNINSNDLVQMQEMIEITDFSLMPKLIEKYLNDIKAIIKIVTGNTYDDIATPKDYFILLFLIMSRMGQMSFQKSIILAAKMSPTRRTEIIAAQKFLTSLN